ncbi:hypothetical protein CHARACLAT_011418 [Characodon lateralis]|uniref:Uncharacterized protein n=1 Tax=Characodon lateralis TaxID=208331 RepID=A0ABU7E2Y1_9TELE|nr:hypothetical protein [Characodon lateralis]
MNQTSANKQNKPPPGPDTFPDLNSTLNQGEADQVPESTCHNRNIVSAQNKTFQTKCCLTFLQNRKNYDRMNVQQTYYSSDEALLVVMTSTEVKASGIRIQSGFSKDG